SYRMLVLPDDVRLDDEIGRRIRKHLDAGKPILASGRSGMDMEGTKYVNPEWGVSYRGECPFHPAYMSVEPAWAEGLPDMPMALYGKCLQLETQAGVEVAARIVAPYYNANWDGEHGLCYTPPDQVTAWPAAVTTRQVAHLASPLFESYYNAAPPFHRELVAKLLRRLFPNPLIANDNLPSYARVMVTAQPGKMLVHILSYLPEKRGRSMQIIEEPIELREVSFQLRVGDARVEQVYAAPDRTPLAHERDGDYIRLQVPQVNGYCLVVVDVRQV
ncbi:MAG: hypothetical protein PHR35_10860, partial [Kiritimatiellae bacterium]|nr:hypothetical protein [Kiritimatiellia bacterium]